MPLQPLVTNVAEKNTLGANRQLQKSIVLTYMVGSFGPFTLVTTQADLQSGVAAASMQQFANTLNALPQQTS
jgi:hypothetical protein